MSGPSAGYVHTLVHYYAPAAQYDLVHYRKDIGFRLPTGCGDIDLLTVTAELR